MVQVWKILWRDASENLHGRRLFNLNLKVEEQTQGQDEQQRQKRREKRREKHTNELEHPRKLSRSMDLWLREAINIQKIFGCEKAESGVLHRNSLVWSPHNGQQNSSLPLYPAKLLWAAEGQTRSHPAHSTIGYKRWEDHQMRKVWKTPSEGQRTGRNERKVRKAREDKGTGRNRKKNFKELGEFEGLRMIGLYYLQRISGGMGWNQPEKEQRRMKRKNLSGMKDQQISINKACTPHLKQAS